ncbi:hypothetical protein A6043_05165 [[Haemophilus] ducreyi]|uniref:Cof-type HAD-IIB family hydrolase n=1 Tax=Haemophilus ducreyi TaxID=730 RepID=UPI0007CE070F|nr:Cof-type HAD-IIB family hydrolase [[Haemophilus] ducreyi]ANF70737.1 hypothetical protein A6043_05165 [[Haemophilus] ducreyi]ANF72080.1 hypothetical protein A6044_03950 [[Haemophilus] ducreyi]
MMTSFQAVVSDLDGTLLNADHTISPFTIEILNKLAHKGIDIFFATGRNYPDVKHIISKINIDQAMLITSNGARANFLSGQQIFSHYLAEDLAEKLMSIPFDNSRVCINTYQGDEWFINTDIEQLKKYHQDSGFCYQVVDFQQHHPRQTEKIFFIAKTVEDLLPIEQYLTHYFGDQIYITYSSPVCLEVMHKTVSKKNALAELVKLRGYTLQDCLAFGDGMNDLEMLAHVGKGCMMSNADQRLIHALPQNEMIGKNTEDAVAKYIQKVFKLA